MEVSINLPASPIFAGSASPWSPTGAPLWVQVFPLTSTGVCQLCPAQEAQVPGASPHGLSVPKTQASSKVISVQCFLSIHCVVTSSIVWATHPYLGDKPNPNWNKHRLFYQTQTASLIDLKDPFHWSILFRSSQFWLLQNGSYIEIINFWPEKRSFI